MCMLSINNWRKLHRVEKFKYLEIKIDKQIKLTDHTNTAIKSISFVNFTKWKFIWLITVDYIIIYNTIILPILQKL